MGILSLHLPAYCLFITSLLSLHHLLIVSSSTCLLLGDCCYLLDRLCLLFVHCLSVTSDLLSLSCVCVSPASAAGKDRFFCLLPGMRRPCVHFASLPGRDGFVPCLLMAGPMEMTLIWSRGAFVHLRSFKNKSGETRYQVDLIVKEPSWLCVHPTLGAVLSGKETERDRRKNSCCSRRCLSSCDFKKALSPLSTPGSQQIASRLLCRSSSIGW